MSCHIQWKMKERFSCRMNCIAPRRGFPARTRNFWIFSKWKGAQRIIILEPISMWEAVILPFGPFWMRDWPVRLDNHRTWMVHAYSTTNWYHMNDSPVDYMRKHKILTKIIGLSWQNKTLADESVTRSLSNGEQQSDVYLVNSKIKCQYLQNVTFSWTDSTISLREVGILWYFFIWPYHLSMSRDTAETIGETEIPTKMHTASETRWTRRFSSQNHIETSKIVHRSPDHRGMTSHVFWDAWPRGASPQIFWQAEYSNISLRIWYVIQAGIIDPSLAQCPSRNCYENFIGRRDMPDGRPSNTGINWIERLATVWSFEARRLMRFELHCGFSTSRDTCMNLLYGQRRRTAHVHEKKSSLDRTPPER
jgi:hypothetical protein